MCISPSPVVQLSIRLRLIRQVEQAKRVAKLGKATFVIGVSGTGKSTIASALADATGATFLDADDFHPVENVDAMRNGVPLTDEMRLGWLKTVGETAQSHENSVYFACSALKESYRDILRRQAPDCRFVLLNVKRETLLARMQQRENHYMPASLLESQLATFEHPTDRENDVLVVDGEFPIDTIVSTILGELSA